MAVGTCPYTSEYKKKIFVSNLYFFLRFKLKYYQLVVVTSFTELELLRNVLGGKNTFNENLKSKGTKLEKSYYNTFF